MSKKTPSKDEALEAIDFIVNVLKEHEKDLDRLINELGTVTERMGDTGELSGKVEKVEERLSNLQNEITNLISYLSTPREGAATQIPQAHELRGEITREKQALGRPVILRCKQWDDFRSLATQAESASFLFKEAEKTFQVDALKNNQVITYSGELPKPIFLLKSWLARQLGVEEKRILEGVLAIS
jgi:cob(I)alamin adenosyltransferase